MRSYFVLLLRCLLIKVERLTLNLLFAVGSGTGYNHNRIVALGRINNRLGRGINNLCDRKR